METRMSDSHLDDILLRCSAATPGPWIYGGPVNRRSAELPADVYYPGHPLAEEFYEIGIAGQRTPPGVVVANDRADAEFVAHARMDVPLLVEEVMRLREALGE